LNSTIAIFDMVRDDLERVEQKMREDPNLTANTVLTSAVGGIRDFPPHPALSATIDYLVTSGGKRLRPALTLMVGHIYPSELERIVALAAAVELLHTATLVHDDLIDGALLRRGNPTLNAVWTPSATVLTGDYLFARAADLAAQTDHVRVMRLFAHTLMVICSGEIKQMFDAVAALREFGAQLGTAFQIVDDVLDFVGDEERMGKPVGSDLRAGLVTLPTLWFLERHNAAETVHEVLNNGRKDDSSVRTAVSIIRESGAIEAALDEARQFVQYSQAALELLPPSEYRDALWELSDFVVDRKH
jgi:geranylgeranyl pyrophosphate synthase